MNKQTNQAAAAAMKMVSGIPAIKQLIEEEQRKKLDASRAARVACIRQLKLLRAKEIESAQKLESAMAEFKAAEAKLQRLKDAWALAGRTAVEASAQRQNVERVLSDTHGESHVGRCLFILDQMRNRVQQRIDNAEHGRYIDTTLDDGRIISRRPNPAFEHVMAMRKGEFDAAAGAYAEALKLVESDLAPSEVEERVCTLLRTAGYLPNAEPEAVEPV